MGRVRCFTALGNIVTFSHMPGVTLKPIYHQNAKYLASGVGVGQCPRRQNFALEIPTCWYILALPKAKFCVSPDAKPQRQPVEYSLRWVLGVGSRVGHVHFIFFVFISFALDSVFLVEYGLKLYAICFIKLYGMVLGGNQNSSQNKDKILQGNVSNLFLKLLLQVTKFICTIC